MRWLWSILSSLVLVGLIVVAFFFINPAFFVSHILSSKLGMKVTIEKASIGMQKISMDGFGISNPPGFPDNPALMIQDIDITAPLGNYFNDIVRIEQVDLDTIVLRLYFPGTSNNNSNWNQLMSSNGNSSSSSETESYAIIELLNIRNITVEIYHGGKLSSSQKINNLSFKNLKTTKEGISKQITQLILQQIFNNIKNLIDFPLKGAQSGSEDLLKPLNNLNPFK